MGAKTCFLAYSDGDAARVLRAQPVPDRAASHALVQTLFPKHKVKPAPESTLLEAYARGSGVYAGVFPGLSILSAVEFNPDRPSLLDPRFLRAARGARFVYLHAMHSVVDWFAYAVWQEGVLVRSLSVSPDDGVMEDIGERRKFEEPFWAGAQPVGGDSADEAGNSDEGESYPLPFHPLDMGEAALLDLFGFQLELAGSTFDPSTVPLCTFTRRRKWFGL